MKKYIIFFVLFVIITVISIVITKAVIESDMPVWLKYFILK